MAKAAERKSEKPRAKEQEPEVTLFGEEISETENRWQSDSGEAVWGVFVLSIGGILLANTLGFIPWEFWNHMWQFWPVLLIFLGLHIILGNNILARMILLIVSIFVFGSIIIFGLKQVSSSVLDYIPDEILRLSQWLEVLKR
jgi:hypothetical protein